MARKSILQRLKDLLTGGGKSTPPKARASNNRESRKVVSSNTSDRRAYVNAVRGERDDLKREDPWAKTKKAFKATSSKATPDPKDAIREKARKEYRAERAEWHKATNNRYNVGEKGISEEERKKRRQNIKMRPYDSKTAVAEAKHTMKYHKKAESFARGALSGVTFGASDLVAKYGTKGEAKKAENVYQKNKSKGAETAGEVAGSLVSFGGVGKAGGKAVGKLTATKGGKKLIAKTAESKLVKASAKRSAERAVKKGVEEKVSKELLEKTAKRKAERLVKGLGTDAFINATGGLVSDVNRADAEHERFSPEWWKEMGKSAALNVAVGGASEVIPALAPVAKPYADEAAEAAARKLRSEAGKIDVGDAKKAVPQNFDNLANNFEKINPDRTNQLKKIYPEVRIKRVFAEDKNKKIIFGENELGELFVGDPWNGFGSGAHRDPYRGFEGGYYKADNYEQAKKDYIEMLGGKMPKGKGKAKASVKPEAPKPTAPNADSLVSEYNELKAVLKRDEDIISEYDYDKITRRINEIERELKAGTKAPLPKDWREAMADADDFDAFVKANSKNKDVKDYVKKENIGGLKRLWRESRVARGKDNLREMSVEEATDIVRRAMPENVRDGWFRDADSAYKQSVSDAIAKDPDAINAGMNIAYRNYVDVNPENALPFDEWLVTPQKMYRGAHGQELIDGDDFLAFTPDKSVAEKFAGKGKGARVDEITVRPIDTLGSYQTTAEQEVLIPKSVIDTAQSANETVAKSASESAVVPKDAPKDTGKGERTEFRRSKEETAKEQARKKRTTGNKQKATQESFDKDFADFNKKIGDAQEKIAELKGRMRVASEDEKAAIKKQIDDLNAEVKSAYSRASLRYHPDRGGSNEWMGKFNESYDSFKRGSYSSRGFKSAESTTRAKAESSGGGGGGKTPPPRRPSAPSEGGNFRKPKGRVKKANRTVSSVEDIVHKSRESVSSKEKVKNSVQAIKRQVSNSMATLEDINLKDVKTDPEKWKVRNAAIDKHRRYNALATRTVDEAQLKANGKRYSGTVKRVGADGKTYEIQNGKSLKQIYHGMDEDTEVAFDAYLLLKHAPDRIRENTPIFDRINLDRGNGEVIKNLNDPKVVKEEAERLLKQHPEFAEKAEEIYQYTRNELENRVQAGLLSQETASKWMHDHPFYVPTGRDGYFNAVHGNHKGVVGADSLKATKGSDLDIRSIKEQLAEATSRNWRDITANDLLEKFFGDKVQRGISVNNGVELLNETVGLAKSRDGRKYYAKIFRNGDINRVEIDKNVYDDLEDLYKNGRIGAVADTVADATSKFSGTFKKLVTSWNPIFLPKNFSRDFGEAIINTRQTKEFFECLAPAWKELATDGAFAQAFKDSGVSQANFVNINESLNKSGKLSKAVDKFVALQDMTESFPRLAEYMATLKKAGVNISDPNALKNVSTDILDQAAANAADVTVNFSRSGSVGKNLNKGLVPFFNPSVQGWSKFMRNFSEQRGTKQLLGTIGKALVLGAGVNAVNNFLLDDNQNYQQISARDKATNIIIPVTWGKDRTADNTNLFIKIPQSRFAAVYGLPTVNVANENKMGWAEMIKVARDQVLPVDPTESSLFAPLYQAANNKTWYGTPIESDYLVDNYAPSERYDANTSPIGKALGKATSFMPEELQISPKKADYVIDAATGVAGDFILPMSTAAARGDNVAKTGANVVKKAFMIDSTTQNNLYARFSDKLKKATTDNNSKKAGDAEKKEYDRMNAYSNKLKDINRAIKQLQDTDPKKNQHSIYEMQKVRNQMIQDALDGKEAPTQSKTLDAVQKYVGTSYAVENFGTSADKDAMQAYGAAKYGELSDAQMRKKIDADKTFYKGVSTICKLDDRLKKAGLNGKSSTLSKAVALASIGADDDLFGAYRATKKGRTESANKAERAKSYLDDGGSVSEFVKLEKARKTLGKLTDYDESAEQDKNYKRLQKGEISLDEYYAKEDEINYNANLSYVGLATSFAQANAPSRGYALYDIKAKNAQKGINLAAMGYTSRDYRRMAKEVDADGNGYPSRKEVISYVANSDVEDKATLFDALYYYKGSNPFGSPTTYSREQAAAVGKANGVKAISNETGGLKLKADTSSGSGYGYGGYGRRRRGYRRYGGGGGKAKVPTTKVSDFKASKATYKDMASSLPKRRKSVSESPVVKVEPPKVKFKKYEV